MLEYAAAWILVNSAELARPHYELQTAVVTSRVSFSAATSCSCCLTSASTICRRSSTSFVLAAAGEEPGEEATSVSPPVDSDSLGYGIRSARCMGNHARFFSARHLRTKTEAIWHHTFYNKLRMCPEERPVLLTEGPLTPKARRERMTMIMFETFDCPAVCVCSAAWLALTACGKSDGLVLDLGAYDAPVVPINEGYVIPHAIERLGFGGEDLTEYMRRLLAERGHELVTPPFRPTELEVARDIKEKHACVALDFEEEVRQLVSEASEATLKPTRRVVRYTLPSGNSIDVFGSDSLRCAESLFQPSLIGKEETTPGIHTCVRNAVQKVTIDSHRYFYENIVLAGGTSMLPGLAERLSKEVTALAPRSMRIKTVAPAERGYSGWIGGSILASRGSFQEMCMTSEEYWEAGPTIVHQKCCC